MKEEIKEMLKISELYLDKQKVLFLNITLSVALFSAKRWQWRPNFPHQRFWIEVTRKIKRIFDLLRFD